MSKWKDEALLKYKEECFKQTRPYQYEIAYLDEGGELASNPPTSASGTTIFFPNDDSNILNFEGINTEYIIFICKDGVYEKNMIDRMLSVGAGADIIYCDEDYTCDVTADLEDVNVRIRTLRTPWRKPEYSPDTLMSMPYIETCFAIRTVFARMVPVLKKTPEISDNVRVWDFLLRAIERTDRIIHVPEVLYHRDLRMLLETTLDPKNVPDEEIYKTLERIYNRPEYQLCREAAAKRRGLLEAIDNVKGPLVSIIIPSKDQPELLKKCIRMIRVNAGSVPYEIIVVDNGSSEEARSKIKSMLDNLPNVTATYLYGVHEFDFSRMCNNGAMVAKAPYLLFLNDDVETVEERFLEKMLPYARMPHIGAVGVKLLYPQEHRIQHTGVTNISKGPTHKLLTLNDDVVQYYCRNRFVWDVLAVTGACLMIDREKYFQVGGFSDKMKIGYNDVDLCVKLLENHYFNVVINECTMIHHESISRGLDIDNKDKALRLKNERMALYEEHPWLLSASDPFYSPKLDVDTIAYKSIVVPDYQVTDYRNKHRKLDKIPGKKSDHIQFSVDNCSIEPGIGKDVEDAYVFDGWVFDDKKNNAYVNRYVLFIPIDESGVQLKECIIAAVSPKYRTDIKEVFPDGQNILLAGFECRIPVSSLIEDVKYRLALCVKGKGKFGNYRYRLGSIYEPGRGIITEN